MDSDSDNDWDPPSDTEEDWSDAVFGDESTKKPSTHGDSGDVPLIMTITTPAPTPKPKPRPAALRVFAIPELLENILLHIEPGEMPPDDAHPIAGKRRNWEPQKYMLVLQRLCTLRRVSDDFDQTITGSPKLRRRMETWKSTWQGRGGEIFWLMEKLVGLESFDVRQPGGRYELGVRVPKLDVLGTGADSTIMRLDRFCRDQGARSKAKWRATRAGNGGKLEVMISRVFDRSVPRISTVIFVESATLGNVFEWYQDVLLGQTDNIKMHAREYYQRLLLRAREMGQEDEETGTEGEPEGS